MSVVPFPEKTQYTILCTCGCTSFMAFIEGSLECTDCGKLHETHNELLKMVAEAPTVDDVETTKTTQTASVDFAKELILSKIDTNTVGIFVASRDGKAYMWNDAIETEEEIAWFKERLDHWLSTLEGGT